MDCLLIEDCLIYKIYCRNETLRLFTGYEQNGFRDDLDQHKILIGFTYNFDNFALLVCNKYPWEKYQPTYSPIFGLNSTTTVLLKGWI